MQRCWQEYVQDVEDNFCQEKGKIVYLLDAAISLSVDIRRMGDGLVEHDKIRGCSLK